MTDLDLCTDKKTAKESIVSNLFGHCKKDVLDLVPSAGVAIKWLRTQTVFLTSNSLVLALWKDRPIFFHHKNSFEKSVHEYLTANFRSFKNISVVKCNNNKYAILLLNFETYKMESAGQIDLN